MPEQTKGKGPEALAKRYFELIRRLRGGDEAAVEELMALWDEDGTFQFVGAPPVEGTFSGAAAIRTLYKNRLNSSGMRLALEPEGREVALGVVDTDVTHLRHKDDRVIAGWRTVVGTAEGHGFDVPGSHRFTFQDGRIQELRITVSPRAHPSELDERLRM